MRSASKYLGVVAFGLVALALTVLQLQVGAGTTTQPRAVGDLSPAGPNAGNPNGSSGSPTNQSILYEPPSANVGLFTGASSTGHAKQGTYAVNARPATHATLLSVEHRRPVATKGHPRSESHPGDRRDRDDLKSHTHQRQGHTDSDDHGRKHRDNDDKGTKHRDDDDKRNKHEHHVPKDDTRNDGKRYDDGAFKSPSNTNAMPSVHERGSVRSTDRDGHNDDVSQSGSDGDATNQSASSLTQAHAAVSAFALRHVTQPGVPELLQ